MIEFKGKYYPLAQANAVDALIQYDGILLHVWHLSDPFHRVVSSDEFQLDQSMFKNTTIVNLPNGGHVETEDDQALQQLAIKHCGEVYTNPSTLWQNWVFMLLGSITCVLAALWLIKNGLLF